MSKYDTNAFKPFFRGGDKLSHIFIKGVEMKISNICFKVALLGSLVCSSALAKGAFVGVSGGYNYKSGNELKVDDGKIKDAVPTFGVKGGYDFDVARRVYLRQRGQS